MDERTYGYKNLIKAFIAKERFKRPLPSSAITTRAYMLTSGISLELIWRAYRGRKIGYGMDYEGHYRQLDHVGWVQAGKKES